MKKISLLAILATLLVTISSCDSGNRIDTEIFSVEAPAGYITDGDIPDFDGKSILLLKTLDGSSAFYMLAYPFKGNPEKMIYMQTFGGGNEALRDATFTTDIEPFKFGSTSGFKVDMKGRIDGNGFIGTAYCLTLDSATILIFSINEDNTTHDIDRKLIESIRINENFKNTMDSRAQIESIVALARGNVPSKVDKYTTWSDILVDHDKKEVILVMRLSGSADDYEKIDDALTEERKELARNLKDSREDDLLILVPTANGYSIGYNYVTADDNVTIATIRFTPEEIND